MKTRRTERAGKAVGGGGVSWGGRVAYFKEGKHKQEEMRRLKVTSSKKRRNKYVCFFTLLPLHASEELQALFNMKLQHCTVCIYDRKSYRAVLCRDFLEKPSKLTLLDDEIG